LKQIFTFAYLNTHNYVERSRQKERNEKGAQENVERKAGRETGEEGN
jgi:hypothetical protein